MDSLESILSKGMVVLVRVDLLNNLFVVLPGLVDRHFLDAFFDVRLRRL